MSMKLLDFITDYQSKKTDEEKEDFVIEHIRDDYVPYEQKIEIAMAIAKSCYWKQSQDINGDNVEYLHVDSPAKYMLTCMAMFDVYTDIDRQKNNGSMLEDFNILNENDIFNVIVSNINQKELKEFHLVLHMVCDDLITNEYENHAFIAKQVERFGNLIGASLIPILEQIDTDKIVDFLKKNHIELN